MVKKIILTGNTINWPGIKQKMFLKGKIPPWDGGIFKKDEVIVYGLDCYKPCVVSVGEHDGHDEHEDVFVFSVFVVADGEDDACARGV